MIYNVIEIINENLTDTELKKIINEKIYNIVDLLEMSLNSSE